MACNCPTKIRIVGNATAGGSLLNPLDAGCLYDMNKYHDWDCVHTNDGVAFTIDTTIEVGDCNTPTYFRDYGHDFTFGGAHNFKLCPPAYLEIGGGQTWTVTEKGQIRDALGVDGDKTTASGGQLQSIDTNILVLETTISGIKERTDNLPDDPAMANEYDATLSGIQSDLDNPDQYKADVSGLALETTVSGIGTDLIRVLGLVQENYYLDQMTYITYQEAKLLTKGRIRIYSEAGSVGTDSDVVAVYNITANWIEDKLQTYKVVKQ